MFLGCGIGGMAAFKHIYKEVSLFSHFAGKLLKRRYSTMFSILTVPALGTWLADQKLDLVEVFPLS